MVQEAIQTGAVLMGVAKIAKRRRWSLTSGSIVEDMPLSTSKGTKRKWSMLDSIPNKNI